MTNFYDALGVSKDANPTEIKKAYRALSLKYHPDRNSTEEAKSKMLEINEAYETLSDDEKRKHYDMTSAFGGGGAMGGMPFQHMSSMDEFSDINQIFNMMFGGGGMPPGMMHMGGGPGIRVFQTSGGPGSFRAEFSTSFHQQQPPPTINKEIYLALDQCYSGTSMPIEIDKWTIINGAKVMEHKTINVTFPPGIDENDVLSLKGAGNEVNENLKGDINIHVKLLNNTCLRRQGLDLVMNKKITLKEALCGFTFDIPHMNGKTFSLNNSVNPSIIQPGFRKVIPNLGMMKDNMTGNLIIELEIEFPELLTPEQTEGLKNIL